MQKKPKIVSLGEWPKAPKNGKKFEASPITKRILSQVHIRLQQILPFTYQRYVHFCQEKKQAIPTQSQYKDQMQRRQKQVQILVSIRNSYILGKDYDLIQQKLPFQKSKQPKKSRVQSKFIKSQSRLSYFNISPPCQTAKISRVDTQRSPKEKSFGMISSLKSTQKRKKKVERQRQQSEYYLNFSKGFKQSEKSLKKNDESTNIRLVQSTKSKANRTTVKQEYEYDVMNNINLKQRKKSFISKSPQSRLNRVKSSKSLYQQLLSTLWQWQNLDQKHIKEVQEMANLSQKERDRLFKMQLIQKQKMRSQMKNIKKRLNSESKLIKPRNTNFCLE